MSWYTVVLHPAEGSLTLVFATHPASTSPSNSLLFRPPTPNLPKTSGFLAGFLNTVFWEVKSY